MPDKTRIPKFKPNPDAPEYYDALGIIIHGGDPSVITPQQVQKQFDENIVPRLSPNLPESERNLLYRAKRILTDPPSKARYDKEIYPQHRTQLPREGEPGFIAKLLKAPEAMEAIIAPPAEPPVIQPVIKTVVRDAESALEKLSIRNPLVLLGATALAAGSAVIAVRATRRINAQKDEGNKAAAQDTALQALGFTGAAGVISTAAMMWNASSKSR